MLLEVLHFTFCSILFSVFISFFLTPSAIFVLPLFLESLLFSFYFLNFFFVQLSFPVSAFLNNLCRIQCSSAGEAEGWEEQEYLVLSDCADIKCSVNLLKPTGYVMHQQFNIQQLYILPTLYLCVLYLSENKQRLVPLTV